MRPTIAVMGLLLAASVGVSDPAGPATRPAAPPDPEAFWVEMADGTVRTGRLSPRQLTVRTAEKTLAVPIARLLSFHIGLDAKGGLAKRIDALIRDLAADDYRKRQAAQDKLIAMGPALRPILKPYAKDRDAERALRIGFILEAYDTWEPKHPGAPRSAIEPMLRQTRLVTASGAVAGRILDEQIGIAVGGGIVKVKIRQIHRAFKVGSKPNLDACLIHGRTEGHRTDFVKDVPVALTQRHRRITKTAAASGPVVGRHATASWLYPVRGRNEIPRVFVADGKKYYPIWGTWRQRWREGWKYLDHNGAHLKGAQVTAPGHYETRLDYYVVSQKPPRTDGR